MTGDFVINMAPWLSVNSYSYNDEVFAGMPAGTSLQDVSSSNTPSGNPDMLKTYEASALKSIFVCLTLIDILGPHSR